MMISNLDFQENVAEAASLWGGSASDLLDRTISAEGPIPEGGIGPSSRITIRNSVISDGLSSAKNTIINELVTAGLAKVSGAFTFLSQATTPNAEG